MADKLDRKVLVIVGVSLLVLVVGFFLLRSTGVVTTGQAWNPGQEPPPGYYWEQEPLLDTNCISQNIEGCYFPALPAPASPLHPNQEACYYQNSYISINNFYKLCGPASTWIPCYNNQGVADYSEKFFCIPNKWYVCSEDTEGQLLFNDEYVCNDQKWIPCNDDTESPFCKTFKWNFKVSSTTEFSKVSGITKIELKGESVDENDPQGAVDVALNNIFYNVISPQKDIYFKYDGTFYKIKFDQQFKLSVSTIGNQEIASETLQKEGTHFAPAQLELDFDNDGKDDAYVNMVVGTPYGNKELLLVVSPRLDFESYDKAVTILSSGDTKEFSFLEDYTFNMFENQGNYIMVIQNNQHVVTEGSQGTHYLDNLNTKSIGYNSSQAFGKFVILKLDSVNEYISISLSPQEEVNLEEEYEAHFDNDVVLDIEDEVNGVPFGLVGICENDPPVLYTLTVCNKDQEIFDLTDEEVHVEGDLLFLYNQPEEGAAKTGNVYKIIDLQQEQEQLATIFANNLVDGKSVVLKAHDEYYLLSSEDGNYLDLTQLRLKRLGKNNEANFLPDGNQEDIVFNLPLGKQINIQLQALPNLRYILSSVTILKDNVNLVNELQAGFSTYGTVTIANPNTGEISLNELEDIKLLQNTMKIEIESGSKKVELIKGEPYVDTFNNVGVMFLYNTFSVDGISNNANTYAKYADVYLYSDLTGNSFEHDFNSEDFILPLVKGNSIAFSLEGEYYLLSYSEIWTGQQDQGFQFEKMQLTSLDGESSFPLQPEGDHFVFDLGDNKVKVEVDTNNNLITFTGITAAEVAQVLNEFNSEEEFSATLTPGTDEAQVILNVDGVDYEICDEGDIKTLKTQVFLCHDNAQENLALNQEKITTNGKVRYKYLGEINGEKTVIFQHIFTLDNAGLVLPWTEAADNLAAGRNPIFDKDGEFIELSGGKDLAQFMLENKQGQSYSITMQSNVEAFENGTVAVGKEQVFFQKSLIGSKIWLDMNLLDYPLVTEEGLEVDLDTSTEFTVEIGGEKFMAQPSTLLGFSDLILVQITKDNLIEFSGFFPEGAVKNALLSDGSLVTLEVLEGGKLLISK